MRPFADHFSDSSAGYAAFRPKYPDSLFTWLAGQVIAHECAWDCATGSGQAASGLAHRFGQVIATDASPEQIANAVRTPKVEYAVMRAEESALATRSVSLVTVAQALHWFDRALFYAEALRVLRPGGVLAVWRYGLASVDPFIDALIERFYSSTVGPYWPAERAIVDAGYASIEFPLADITAPPFVMEASWTMDQLTGYLRTWSAVARYRAARGVDPVALLIPELADAWGDHRRERLITWPLEVRLGRV